MQDENHAGSTGATDLPHPGDAAQPLPGPDAVTPEAPSAPSALSESAVQAHVEPVHQPPIEEATEPVTPLPQPVSSGPPAEGKRDAKEKSKVQPKFLFAVFGTLLLAGAVAGGFWYGRQSAPKTAANSQSPKGVVGDVDLEVPAGAVVIAQCAVGRGTQYVLPKDIPQGPVYNVWKNKVIGVEFMVGKNELISQNKSYLNLPLNGIKYNHVNIGLVSSGHAGFPEPHYHVDIFTVPAEQTQEITCK